jgi:hypothetical protein
MIDEIQKPSNPDYERVEAKPCTHSHEQATKTCLAYYMG